MPTPVITVKQQTTRGLTVSLRYSDDGSAHILMTFGVLGAQSECRAHRTTWDTLYEIGTALDECARKLRLDADRRVWLQRLVQEAHMSLIDDMKRGEDERAGRKRRRYPSDTPLGVPDQYLYS